MHNARRLVQLFCNAIRLCVVNISIESNKHSDYGYHSMVIMNLGQAPKVVR